VQILLTLVVEWVENCLSILERECSCLTCSWAETWLRLVAFYAHPDVLVDGLHWTKHLTLLTWFRRCLIIFDYSPYPLLETFKLFLALIIPWSEFPCHRLRLHHCISIVVQWPSDFLLTCSQWLFACWWCRLLNELLKMFLDLLVVASLVRIVIISWYQYLIVAYSINWLSVYTLILIRSYESLRRSKPFISDLGPWRLFLLFFFIRMFLFDHLGIQLLLTCCWL